MALSTQRVVSDGSLTLLSLSIDYFDRTDITVLFDNVQRLPGNGWDWVGTTDKKISFTPAVPVNVEVKLKRTTVMSLPRHQYTSGAQFVAETLDENFKQVLYVAQETSEGGALTEVFNDLDMHGFRLRRIGQAIEDDEAVSLAQYKADAAGANQAKLAAQASQADALASKNAAKASEDAALASKDAAATSATNAATSETNALASKNAAATSATNAATSESNALTSKNDAAASLTDFKNRYQGAKATAPTTRTDGSALQTGDLYYDTALLVLRIRTATPEWADAASANTYTKAESDAKYPLASAVYTKTEVDALADQGFRNKLYNGAFDVWQRGTSFNGAHNTFHNYYGADRWQMFRAGGAAGATFSRVAYNGPNAVYAARMQRNSGDTSTATLNLTQSLETIDIAYLKGKTVTVSFRYLTGANFSGPSLSFYTSYGTGSDGNMASGFSAGTGVPGGSKTCPASTSQRYETITFNVPSNASQFGIGFGYAPSGTAGANDFAEITNVQLEIGSLATPFAYRPQATELALCLRYYESGTAAMVGTGYNNANFGHNIPFKVHKRKAPASAEIWQSVTNPVNVNSGAPGSWFMSASAFGHYLPSTGGAGAAYAVQYTLDWAVNCEV